jgi:hypothetical protein
MVKMPMKRRALRELGSFLFSIIAPLTMLKMRMFVKGNGIIANRTHITGNKGGGVTAA